MNKLTAKQQLFVNEYLVDLNATQAAIRAGYSEKTAGQIGEQNLKKLEIANEIEKRMKDREKRTEITQDMVLKELARLAFFDIRKIYDSNGNLIPIKELDDDTAAAIIGVDVSEVKVNRDSDKAEIEYTKKIKIADKRASLVDVGKHLGMFVEKSEVEHKGNVGVNVAPELTKEEWLKAHGLGTATRATK